MYCHVEDSMFAKLENVSMGDVGADSMGPVWLSACITNVVNGMVNAWLICK